MTGSADMMRYLLAKIHMVAKPPCNRSIISSSYLLAKIHMVAKPIHGEYSSLHSYLLAKIHMVAKPQTDFIT